MHNHISQRYRKLELLTTPSSIFSSLILDLQRARESIDMEYYIFANDRTGRLFADILSRKARQGLRVRLIVDGYGSISLGNNVLHSIAADGVELTRHALLSHSRHHRKIAIIDGSIAHVGGINIADRYVVGNGLGVWYDAQLRITGEAVGAIAQLFDYDYMVSEDIVCEVPSAYGNSSLHVTWSECRSGRAMAELLNGIIARARDNIIFVTPYFMPPESVLDSLEGVVDRGVRVMIIVPERCDVLLLDHVMRRHLSMAVQRGIEVRICRRSFVHAKLAIVDGCKVVVGSANLDARSINLNQEIMVTTDDRGVVEAAESFVGRLLKMSSVPAAQDVRSLVPAFVCRWFEDWL